MEPAAATRVRAALLERGWTGTRAAWLSIVGYLCVVFNFTIVNQFFNGLHSYSGL